VTVSRIGVIAQSAYKVSSKLVMYSSLESPPLGVQIALAKRACRTFFSDSVFAKHMSLLSRETDDHPDIVGSQLEKKITNRVTLVEHGKYGIFDPFRAPARNLPQA
jgi:hypothetical protein